MDLYENHDETHRYVHPVCLYAGGRRCFQLCRRRILSLYRGHPEPPDRRLRGHRKGGAHRPVQQPLGGAVSSFATGASSHYTAAILSHQTDACEGTEKAELTVRFSSPYGDVQDYVICGECGDVNGESGLSKVKDAYGNFSELYVYQGKLDNGERVMTVSCLSSGANAMSGVTANVMLPWSAVEGYDLYLVNADGTETKLESYGTDWAYLNVYLDGGTALIRMVEQ